MHLVSVPHGIKSYNLSSLIFGKNEYEPRKVDNVSIPCPVL